MDSGAGAGVVGEVENSSEGDKKVKIPTLSRKARQGWGTLAVT